ncbi:MAG: hypothetical protein ACFFB3_19845 [Candidatus Hodarchaeota archaeon]
MLNDNLAKALNLLDKAEIIGEEKELAKWVEEVAAEKKQVQNQSNTWEHLIQSNAPTQARMEQTRLEEYVKRVLSMIASEK